jgi:hypothetical protein
MVIVADISTPILYLLIRRGFEINMENNTKNYIRIIVYKKSFLCMTR